MQKKTIFLIIGILVIVLIAIILFIVLSRDDQNVINQGANSEEQSIEPKLELTAETEGGITIISVKASIEGDNSILAIYLPDGEVVEDDTAEYEVRESGEYEFRVTASNGTSVTETITIDDTNEASADNPYIPDGFTHVSGTDVETGFVIEDESGNQFVWIPVESGILTRDTDGDEQYEESDSTASGLYNSVAKYYGFYIARYEVSKTTFDGTETVASVEGVLPWTNINYEEAYNVSRNAYNVYGYSDVRTALVNSYAWDSALDWLNQSETNYSSNTSYGNYSGTIQNTGSTDTDIVNSICDMAGNVREWTTEIYYPETTSRDNENTNAVEGEEISEDNENINENTNEVITNSNQSYRVIRGGSANINRVASSHIGQQENMTDAYWGFRIILYKN